MGSWFFRRYLPTVKKIFVNCHLVSLQTIFCWDLLKSLLALPHQLVPWASLRVSNKREDAGVTAVSSTRGMRCLVWEGGKGPSWPWLNSELQRLPMICPWASLSTFWPSSPCSERELWRTTHYLRLFAWLHGCSCCFGYRGVHVHELMSVEERELGRCFCHPSPYCFFETSLWLNLEHTNLARLVDQCTHPEEPSCLCLLSARTRQASPHPAFYKGLEIQTQGSQWAPF